MAAGSPGAGAIPTTICSPSATRLAIFSPSRSAPSSGPPAPASASAIRAPGSNVTSPGLWTRPTTLTTTGSPGWRRGGLRCRTGRRNHLYRRQFGRDNRRRFVARQREQRHQHRDDTDDSQRDDTGPPGIGSHGRHPTRRPARTGVGQPPGQQRVGLAVPVLVGIGLALCAETAMETLGRQFRSHALKARPEFGLLWPGPGTRRGALGMKWRLWITTLSTIDLRAPAPTRRRGTQGSATWIVVPR